MIAMKRYDPAVYWPKVSSPTLIIDANDEELFDRRVNDVDFHQSLNGRVITAQKAIKGEHCHFYRDEGCEEALNIAQDQFVEHLK